MVVVAEHYECFLTPLTYELKKCHDRKSYVGVFYHNKKILKTQHEKNPNDDYMP